MSADNATRPFPPTTRTETRRHTTSAPRGLETTPASSIETGRFGRMFRHLPVFNHDIKHLKALAATMVGESAAADKPLGVPDEDEENPTIPAGYTYLGQFIDHDITFDPASSLIRQNDPNALTNFRTPRLDLDSLYGRGPADQPFLYQRDEQYERDGLRLALGPREKDLQRNADGRALLGDPRNDENQIVAQIQILFIQFHNMMVEAIANDKLDGVNPAGLREPEDLFKEAQRQVRWHYQWLVIHDFLRRVVGKQVIKDILPREKYHAGGRTFRLVRPRFLFYHWREDPFMPVEFSVAAYRFGHSMVRPSYHLNEKQRKRTEKERRRIDAAGQQEKEKASFRIPIFSIDDRENLNGFQPLPISEENTLKNQDHRINWSFFFDLGDKTTDSEGKTVDMVQPSYQIDTLLSEPLADLRGARLVKDKPTSLAERNLIRGLRLGLPSGQEVARAMGITPLDDVKLDIKNRKLKPVVKVVNGVEQEIQSAEKMAEALTANTPLWFYILREAEFYNKGERLGPVGARIVAEVIIGLIAADPLSYLGVHPNWRPHPSLANDDGEFGMPELIRFVGARRGPGAAEHSVTPTSGGSFSSRSLQALPIVGRDHLTKESTMSQNAQRTADWDKAVAMVEKLKGAEEKYDGEGRCSLLVTFTATKLFEGDADGKLRFLPAFDPERFDAKLLAKEGIEWEILGSDKEKPIWKSGDYDRLKVERETIVTGRAEVPVSIIIKAIAESGKDTGLPWTIDQLFKLTEEKDDQAPEQAPDQASVPEQALEDSRILRDIKLLATGPSELSPEAPQELVQTLSMFNSAVPQELKSLGLALRKLSSAVPQDTWKNVLALGGDSPRLLRRDYVDEVRKDALYLHFTIKIIWEEDETECSVILPVDMCIH